ncbi:hypothetical protein [Kitasatospora sp. DSM 101779]|uniref:hypothetical protein n=1 Tax=Kitasatospora sp. DSM 101779 TaxID=2853165 RepID=UPI0037EE8E65|nr:hypothetical protein [Kitasatospora sp. DSM 101779]
MQEVQREPLLGRVGVELALAGGRDGRVHEQQDVLGGDQIARRLHGSAPVGVVGRPGNGGTNCESSL